MLQILHKLSVLLTIVTLVFAPLLVFHGQTLAQGLSEPCSLDSSEPCEPPSLREVEYLVVRVIYAAWAFGGVVFMVLLVVIGGLYLGSAGDQAKVEAAKKRAGQWVIGVLLYFLSQPITATLMRGLISGDAACFDVLRDPGFTFFFATVCDIPDEIRDDLDPGDYTITSCAPMASRLESECSQICGREYTATQPGCRNAPSLPCTDTSDSSSTTPGQGYRFYNVDGQTDVTVHLSSITCLCNLNPTVNECSSVGADTAYPQLPP